LGKKQAVLRDPRKNRIIVLEDLNFMWDEEELFDIECLWNDGSSIMYISNYFDRDPDEVILAIMHLAKEDRIVRRKGGLAFGL
jgi:hypothetical protein